MSPKASGEDEHQSIPDTRRRGLIRIRLSRIEIKIPVNNKTPLQSTRDLPVDCLAGGWCHQQDLPSKIGHRVNVRRCYPDLQARVIPPEHAADAGV